jgi:hypothetical protein
MKEIFLILLVEAIASLLAHIPITLRQYEERDWANRLEEMDRVQRDFDASRH